MKKLLLIMALFVLFFSVGCSNEKDISNNDDTKQPVEENEQEQKEKEDEKEPKEEPKEEPPKEDQAPVEEPPLEDESLINHLKKLDLIGKDLDEVKNELGAAKVDHKDAVMHAWRYDFSSANYTYENELISVDVEGLLNGNMEAQLFIYFEDEAVSLYSIYYLVEEDIMQYMVTPNGAEEFNASAD